MIREMSNSTMTKVFSAEVFVSLAVTVITMTFFFGVTYSSLAEGVDKNKSDNAATQMLVNANAEKTGRDIKEIHTEISAVKSSVAGIAATQQVQARAQELQAQQFSEELRAIRQILENRR